MVKRAIATMCLASSLKKSCDHKMHDSFCAQIGRLAEAGYPRSVVGAVAESLLQKLKGATKAAAADSAQRLTRPEVMPYVHRVSHSLKKVAGKYGVPIVFSAPRKLSVLCSRISGKKTAPCEKKHERPSGKCAVGVVYEIPLSCGKVYIGQTGRCINDRAREHLQDVKRKEKTNLAEHCNTCMCDPRLSEIKIKGRSANMNARLVLEAFLIWQKGTDCVSDTSISLYAGERGFLAAHV